MAISDFVPLGWGPPRMQGLRSNSALFWAAEKARLRQPLLFLFPFVGEHRECKGYVAIAAEAATKVFVPLCWGAPRMQGLHSNCALFWANFEQDLEEINPKLQQCLSRI